MRNCPVCMSFSIRRPENRTCGSRECVKEWISWSLDSRRRRERYASLSLAERVQYDADTAARLKPDPNYVPSLDVEPEKMDYMELLTPKAKAEVSEPSPTLPPSDNRTDGERTVEDEKEARRLRNLAFLETIKKK